MILVIPLMDWSERGKKIESAFGGVDFNHVHIGSCLSVYNRGIYAFQLHTVAYTLPDHISPFDAAAGE